MYVPPLANAAYADAASTGDTPSKPPIEHVSNTRPFISDGFLADRFSPLISVSGLQPKLVANCNFCSLFVWDNERGCIS